MKINVVIPMAGEGSRFSQAGYAEPKPFIQVGNKAMVIHTITNILYAISKSDEVEFHFIAKSKHVGMLREEIDKHMPELLYKVYEVDKTTIGAAVTTLAAAEGINNDDSLILANVDQYIAWTRPRSLSELVREDAGIVTFPTDRDPKWSYVLRGEDGKVVRVAEKDPISDEASTGIYTWNRGKDYINAVGKMLAASDTTRGEYYVCPCYNYTSLKISAMFLGDMHGIGTPEDLQEFLQNSSVDKGCHGR